LKPEHLKDHSQGNLEVAVRMTSSPYTLSQANSTIKERDELKYHCEKLNQAMQAYLTDMKRIRKMLNDIQSSQEGSEVMGNAEEVLKEGITKKLLKTKQTEDDNKKLRKLLK
jgi:hypothetical protein